MPPLRSLPNPRDLCLSKMTLAWCEGFAGGRHPIAICEQFPRVANRIAICWGDKALTGLLFDDLLSSRRSGRRGFPPAVQAELLMLRDLAGLGVARAPSRDRSGERAYTPPALYRHY